MAHIFVVLTAIAGVSYVVFRLLDSLVQARRIAARKREWGCEEPPLERFRLPFGIDNVRAALKADEDKVFPHWMVSRAENLGAYTWKYYLFGRRIITTHEPQNVQAILATQFGTFDVGPLRRTTLWPMLGNGIFTQSQGEWKHSRDLLRPQFTRDQVSDLDLEERHVQNMMRALDVKLQNGGASQVVDLQDLFFRLTLDSATEFLTGESADSQLQHIPGFPGSRNSPMALRDVNFAWAFDRGQKALATRSRFGPLSWVYTSGEFRECIRQCNKFMDYYVNKILDDSPREKAGPDGPAAGRATKPKYVFLEALAEQTRDPIELRSQMMNILLAGRDTTASMLGWMFKELARDPARYKKLRDVVVDEFGTYADPKNLTFANLKACQYLQHCNNEVLRLYPLVPINARYAYKDTTIPTGGGPDGKSPVFVQAGHGVEYCTYVLQRRKDIWGPDADEFVPERWENRKVGWEFVPFNGGPRICLGQQFALTEASYVTVRLLQRFEKVQDMETDKTIRHNLTLTTCSGNGVKVSLQTAAA